MTFSLSQGWEALASLPARRLALVLLSVATLKALLILGLFPPSYGSDGSGYLAYISAFHNPAQPDAQWHIRGTTPVYPFFAYAGYWLGGGTGYLLVGWQIALGCLVAPSLYLALRHLHPQGAFLGALFVALDPQTAYLGQLVATEALYIALLGLGMAVFFWALSRPLPWYHWVGVGIFLALGCFARPVGMFLIVPYVFFQLAQTRRLGGALALLGGYALVFLCLSSLHWWRFDFFAPNNNSGLYLGTRLFGVGGLYDPANGPASQYIYDLAQGCNLDLSDQADAEGLVMTRRLRGCLYMAGMDLEEISQTYQRVYAEATRARPLIFLQTMFQQALRYLWMTSDPIDRAGAEAFITDCEAPRAFWYDAGHLFCPALPSPLAPLRPLFFYGLLAFTPIMSW